MAPRVVFTTDDPEHPLMRKLISETGAPILRKPFRLEEVAETCRSMTGGQTDPDGRRAS